MSWRLSSILGFAFFASALPAWAGPPDVIRVWPDRPPGETADIGEERDTSGPDSPTVAGRPVIRLGNVSKPTLTIYRPDEKNNTGTAVIICPGGGHHILAWDLEGTEVAEWLVQHGVTAIVLKYRVPFRDKERRWLAAVQDAQRAVSLVRSRADEWRITSQRIGILGFSAGGETAALTSLLAQRQYEPLDDIDQVSSRPDFAVLVYPGALVEADNARLRQYVQATDQSPPMFFAHAFDDRVRVENSVLLFLELKKAGVPADLHVYATGGHGFGLRPTDEPCSQWPQHCLQWLRRQKLLESATTKAP
jgi:acetyl esterase/lipase